jgi:hypothetical protein
MSCDAHWRAGHNVKNGTLEVVMDQILRIERMLELECLTGEVKVMPIYAKNPFLSGFPLLGFVLLLRPGITPCSNKA